MIKGSIRKEDDWLKYDPERFREENYYYSLVEFEGVEGVRYGIMDELHDLDKLIETLGKTVVKEEQEFKVVENASDPDGPFPSEEVLKVWHKKMYRQFTYKSIVLLIHTTFETGMVNLYNILVSEGRIPDTVRRKNVIDILKALKHIDPAVQALIDPIRAYNFIRNKFAHMDGYYKDPDTDIDAFRKFIKTRTDITIKQLTTPKGKHTHKMTVNRSIVLTDYLSTIKKVFEALLKGGKSLPYSPVVIVKKSPWNKILDVILWPFKMLIKLFKRKRS